MMLSHFMKDSIKWACLHAACSAVPAMAFLGPSIAFLLLAAGVFTFSLALQAVLFHSHAGMFPTLPKGGRLLDADWKHWWARHLAAPRFDENSCREDYLLLENIRSGVPETHRAAFEQAKLRNDFTSIIVRAYGYPNYDPCVGMIRFQDSHKSMDRPALMIEAMRAGMNYPRFDESFRPITSMAISPADGSLALEALDLFLESGADISDADVHGVNVLEAMADMHAANKAGIVPKAYADSALSEAAKVCLERGIVVRDECLAKLRSLGDDGAEASALIEQQRMERKTSVAMGGQSRPARL